MKYSVILGHINIFLQFSLYSYIDISTFILNLQFIKIFIKNFWFSKKTGMVTAMDEQIGNIIKDLKSTGHYENSVIVFTTDVRRLVNWFVTWAV